MINVCFAVILCGAVIVNKVVACLTFDKGVLSHV